MNQSLVIKASAGLETSQGVFNKGAWMELGDLWLLTPLTPALSPLGERETRPISRAETMQWPRAGAWCSSLSPDGERAGVRGVTVADVPTDRSSSNPPRTPAMDLTCRQFHTNTNKRLTRL